ADARVTVDDRTRDLTASDQGQASRQCLDCSVDAIEGVVVGQSQDVNTGGVRAPDDISRRVGPVGRVAVAMQVDAHASTVGQAAGSADSRGDGAPNGTSGMGW